MIRLEGLQKKYGRKVAVKSLDLVVHPGQVFGFLGPNGAGKTTTLKMMTGLTTPTQGRVLINGIDVWKNFTSVRDQFGFVPDDAFAYPKLTGKEFLSFAADMRQMAPTESRKRISELMEKFGLASVADTLIAEYSLGMKRKLAFCAALLHEPIVLIMDEPLNGLDPASIRLAKDILRDLADGGGTVFLSTHLLDVAQQVCDHVAIIHHGTLVGDVVPVRTLGTSLEEMFLRVTSEASEVKVI